ncbi:MAG: hypothetical protein ACTSWN_03565 [Promethearchaeota archaeon]
MATPNLFEILGWLLIAIAGIFIALIAFHVESEKPLSYKFTITAVIITSFCIGYGIHFLLIVWGL